MAEPAERLGYRCGKKLRAVASGHMHPHDDFVITSYGIRRNENDPYISDTAPPRLLFIHGNLPKYDVSTVLDWKLEDFDWMDMLRCDDGKGKAHRLWGPRSSLSKSLAGT